MLECLLLNQLCYFLNQLSAVWMQFSGFFVHEQCNWHTNYVDERYTFQGDLPPCLQYGFDPNPAFNVRL